MCVCVPVCTSPPPDRSCPAQPKSRIHPLHPHEPPILRWHQTPQAIVGPTPPVTRTILKKGCSLFTCSWKLPAYNGAFCLELRFGAFFTCNWSFFAYNWCSFAYSWSSFAYSGKAHLRSTSMDYKQMSCKCKQNSPTVSKKKLHPLEST